MMKTKTAFGLLAIASLALSSVAFADGKTYQATGQVVKVSDAVVVIQSGTQKWEIARDASTKGDLKKGSTATVTYMMHATAVDVKAMPATATAKAAPAAKTTPAMKSAPPKMKASAPAASSAVGDPDAQKKEAPNAQKKEKTEPEPTATPSPTPDE